MAVAQIEVPYDRVVQMKVCGVTIGWDDVIAADNGPIYYLVGMNYWSM
jgi:hypothetical protein